MGRGRGRQYMRRGQTMRCSQQHITHTCGTRFNTPGLHNPVLRKAHALPSSCFAVQLARTHTHWIRPEGYRHRSGCAICFSSSDCLTKENIVSSSFVSTASTTLQSVMLTVNALSHAFWSARCCNSWPEIGKALHSIRQRAVPVCLFSIFYRLNFPVLWLLRITPIPMSMSAQQAPRQPTLLRHPTA